jgi:hypothetical protein
VTVQGNAFLSPLCLCSRALCTLSSFRTDKRTQGSIIADAVRRSVGVVDGSVGLLWKTTFTELKSCGHIWHDDP